jgi:hypothetical protein
VIDPACCTAGCAKPGTHERDFYIRGVDPSVYGEVEVTATFCCEHIDMLDSDITPLLDLHVAATVRS